MHKKKRGQVAPLSGPSVTDLYSVVGTNDFDTKENVTGKKKKWEMLLSSILLFFLHEATRNLLYSRPHLTIKNNTFIYQN